MHTLAAIVCLIVAIVLTTGLVDTWLTAPGWVSGLAVVATIALIVSATRVYAKGAERRQKVEGARTKIVIADVPPPSKVHQTTSDE